MREKTHYAHRPEAIGIRNGNAGEQIIFFRQNIERMETETGTEYTADEYVLTVKASANLAERIRSNPAPWLEKAIREDYDRRAGTVRAERDKRIADTDYLMSVDYPINEEYRNALKAYRQALRDLPEQKGFPYDVVFPELTKEDGLNT